MFKARKRRALSSIVTGAILLSAVSVMGIAIVSWANSNLVAHQIELDETFAANHGFTIIFIPTRNDSPPSEFTDITEIFKLIRKYVK